ncbi:MULTISPECIES: plasmid replication protein RepC [Rhizobium]|uniref:Replication protein C n=1 Tax=Rhizobium favelukesii TaxID=348824 RepID=W6RJ16_9HYPH|nr:MULTISPECIES: plasmid replication protein RepC [Rhizobium]MCS0463120.1 replication initiation protein RepC [Rhizobium favelukesii]UFS85177.1 replication initiation protein RepC [Rhizobium sp. T136]CDM61152.1 putative replication protein C [Rhizobium favelukesii]
MESGTVTTPFGRRSMTLGMLSSQVASREIEPDKTVDKWKLYRALCEARPLVGVTDRALAVLNALLSFYPKNALAQEHGLVVFPSNAQLSLRAHGMAEQTIRRHLAVLIEAGLLIRKDSPNGKRYAHKGKSGEIDEAFGFSLAPLLARSEEIERLAAEVVAERVHLQRLRERLTLCRRDITKLIEAALEEGAAGDWMTISAHLRGLLERLPRVPAAGQLAATLDEMEMLREEVVNQLEIQLKTQNQSGNPAQDERHIQNSNPESTSELEPAFETKQGERAVGNNDPNTEPSDERGQKAPPSGGVSGGVADLSARHSLKSFPLGLVLQACPQILDYGPGGTIGNWRDLMSAAIVVRSMLGVSPSAYEEACAGMGAENAATVIACILERGGQIHSAGGYLRDLTRRTERGEFAIGPMLMALVRANAGARRNVS